jgi:hypothetical protein
VEAAQATARVHQGAIKVAFDDRLAEVEERQSPAMA